MTAIPKGMVRDRKTGRIRKKHKVSVKAKSAARARMHHKLSTTEKRKIGKSVKHALMSGRTKAGRRSLLKKKA